MGNGIDVRCRTPRLGGRPSKVFIKKAEICSPGIGGTGGNREELERTEERKGAGSERICILAGRRRALAS